MSACTVSLDWIAKHARPPATLTNLPPELRREIFKIWTLIDPPLVSHLTGGARRFGWFGSLFLQPFRDIARSSSPLWADHITAVPKAFGLALQLSGHSPLTFELSPSVPSLYKTDERRGWEGASSLDLWGELIADADVTARVQRLCLQHSRALQAFAR